ncbi:MAG: hypothetical protein HY318_08475, partial [Armatimonadetes bacterium]|nr:hypothetical protein [Armatimonadota bacterium]
VLTVSTLANVCFAPFAAGAPKAKSVVQNLMIADFEDDGVLSRVDTTEGVKATLTDREAAVSGRHFLEVKEAPFSTHGNLWPSVVLGPKYFISPVDVSRHTRIVLTMRKLTPGLAAVNVTFSTLPYNDGGRNLEGEVCYIPGDGTTKATVPISKFESNDPSAIRLMYITFPPNEREEVYRIDSIQAVDDPTESSPAEILRTKARSLQVSFQTVTRKIHWQAVAQEERTPLQGRLVDLDRQIRELNHACEVAVTSGFNGQFLKRKVEWEELSKRVGQLLLVDKKNYVVWEIDPYINILKDETPDAKSRGLEKIEVQMALGEFRDQVFMVSPCGQGVRLAVGIDPGRLPSGLIEVYETVYMKTNRGPETGDAVCPLKEPLLIPQGESRQVRLRFNTRDFHPKPGRYDFTLKLQDLNSKVGRAISGVLEIWPFALPSTDILSNNNYTEFDSSDFYEGELLAKAVAHMKRYGLNNVYVHPVEMPTVKEVDAEGKVLKYDESAFEKRVGQIVQAWKATPGKERLRFIFTISGMYDPGLGREDIKFPEPKWRGVFAQWLRHLKEESRQLGVADKDWVVVMGDEASESALAQREIPMAEAVKGLDPTIMTTCNTSTVINDPEMSARFFKVFDILQPELTSLKSNAHLREWVRKSGKTLWTYKCNGGLGSRGKNPYEYYRVYAWDLVKYGLTGTGVWTYCAQAQSQRLGGYLLIHRLGDEVMHARRYEMFREGIDDYRYISALREVAKRRGSTAVRKAEKLIQQAVDDVASHVEDTTLCDKWRRRIAKEIIANLSS